MSKFKKFILSLVVLLTITGLVGGMLIPVPARAASLQPQLAQLAMEMPDKVISVIAQKADSSQRAEKLVQKLGGFVTKDLHIINAFAAQMPARAIPTLAASNAVRWVSLDAPMVSSKSVVYDEDDCTTTLSASWSNVSFEGIALFPQNNYLQTLGVRQLHETGLTGQGVTIAVIDSGVDSSHPDLGERVTMTPFSSSDTYGHGTHVAGIIGGDGSASSGFYTGVAPGANIIDLNIADATGMAYVSDVVNAMQWVYDNMYQYNIRVVNMSLNSTIEGSYHESPMAAAAEILWFNGVVVVTSVGNKGPAGGHNTAKTAPANDPFLIVVGASDEFGTSCRGDDEIGSFSSFGFTKDGYLRPEIIAPGFNIIAPLSADSSWDEEYPDRVVMEEYIRLSGTSMAAPIVSGAVALLLQYEPDLSPDQVKYRLTHSGNQISNDEYQFPYLDIYSAVASSTYESANTGLTASRLLWTGDDPVTWNSVSWNSVSWNSVSWNSVSWNSVSWNSVSWNSAIELDGIFWGPRGRSK